MNKSAQSNSNTDLRERWFKLFPTSNAELLHNEFSSLEEKYCESHRHYHNLEHIRACLRSLDAQQHLVCDCYALELALWFHDVIYNPKKSNNEEMSADYACIVLDKFGLSKDAVDKVRDLILLTIHPSKPKTDDEKMLVDIDLGILSAEQELYQSYSEWIRLEYAHVPRFLYSRGRRKLLQTFIASEHLYHSEYYRENFEAQARSNIEKEIAIW